MELTQFLPFRYILINWWLFFLVRYMMWYPAGNCSLFYFLQAFSSLLFWGLPWVKHFYNREQTSSNFCVHLKEKEDIWLEFLSLKVKHINSLRGFFCLALFCLFLLCFIWDDIFFPYKKYQESIINVLFLISWSHLSNAIITLKFTQG